MINKSILPAIPSLDDLFFGGMLSTKLDKLGRNLTPAIDPSFINFFEDFDIFNRAVNFPKYNVIKTDSGVLLEIALAGYNKDDISVSLDAKNILSIQTKSQKEVDNDSGEIDKGIYNDDRVYISRGIAKREFYIDFKLAPNAKIDTAEFINGMLSINIVGETPKAPEVINIPIK